MDLVGVGGEVDERTTFESEERDVRVAVLLVLADGVAPGLLLPGPGSARGAVCQGAAQAAVCYGRMPTLILGPSCVALIECVMRK